MEVELGAAGVSLPREQAALVPQLAGLADGVQRRRQGDPRLLAGAPQGACFLRPLCVRTTSRMSVIGCFHRSIGQMRRSWTYGAGPCAV